MRDGGPISQSARLPLGGGPPLDDPRAVDAVELWKRLLEVGVAFERHPRRLGPVPSRKDLTILSVERREGFHPLGHLSERRKPERVEVGVVGQVEEELRGAAVGARVCKGHGPFLIRLTALVVLDRQLVPGGRDRWVATICSSENRLFRIGPLRWRTVIITGSGIGGHVTSE